MALRPGSCLLMSSHFMPLPRSSMILASSSGDHFDCFLAGDSEGWTGVFERRFAGMQEVGAGWGARLGVDTTLLGAETEREEEWEW